MAEHRIRNTKSRLVEAALCEFYLMQLKAVYPCYTFYMRKFFIGLLFFAGTAYASAQSTLVCTDLPTNLTRGVESKNVLALQQFLYGKGFLKSTPNGYFGPATVTGVKTYQKSVGLPNTGAVLTLTRTVIKKESCIKSSNQSVTTTQIGVTTQQGVSTIATTTVKVVQPPRPIITSLDKGTLFANGSTTWGVILQGTSFSTSSNTVYLRNPATNRKYTIGSMLTSSNNAIITLPNTLTTGMFVCGAGCKQALLLGDYELTVETEGGESDPVYLSIKSFSISSSSGSLSSPIKQNANNVRLGTISFASSVPVYISNINVSTKTEGVTGLSSIYFKDELTGKTITTYGTELTLFENQSKIIGIYGSINSPTSGTITGSVSVTITDFIGKKAVTFTSPEFLTSVFGYSY